MSQIETIQTPQDYVNYTFNIEARGIAEVSSELMGLSNTAGNILGQLAFKTSEFLTHTESMAIGVGLAISSMFVSATRDAINFQQQVANVQAIGGESINAQAIGDAAMEYSNKFGMATASMTEGLEALARAGITSTDVMKEVLSEGVKLSKLEGMDLEDSINDLISTTNLLSENGVDMNDANYGKLVQEMNQHIVSTSESAPINAQNIIQSLQHVGGYASASGMDQDDLFAVIAQLGARGTKGEMAGTALRAFVAAGQKDTAQRALSRVGLDVSDLWNDNGETMLSISEMKNVLDEALESRGYSKQEKLEFYSDFVGYKQANQIMKIDTAEVEKYKESIANAWNLGKKLDTILGTVRGNLDRIWQITQNFMTKVGGHLLTIAGIILEPVRALLEFVTALPGADTAVAIGMIFVAFRTGLLVFNKLVPAVAGFMSGISDARSETKGFRGEWQKTRDELQKTKEIIDLIRHGDQAGLAKKHYEEHGLSARNKMDAERIIAGQMYMGSDWYQQHGRIPWEHIDTAAQDMILERFKGTEEFKQNYNAYVSRTRANVDEIVSKPIIIEEFESQGTLESINVWVQEIFDLLNSDRTRGQTDHAQEEVSQDNRKRNAQARTLSSIFENRVRGNTYGNVNFKYERSEEGYAEAKVGLKKAYKDLREYTQALSNTDTDNINDIQKNAYKKLFTQVSDRGVEATKTANESEVRLVLEQGVLESHENSYEGLKDSQVRYIAEKLGIDDFRLYSSQQGDRRVEFAQKAHEALMDKDENIRQGIIDELVHGNDGNGGTNKLWEDSLADIARGRRELLLHNPEIANKIISQISNINTQGYNSNTDAVLGYFSNLDEDHSDWNIAIKSAMEVLKGDSQYSQIEENTIKYIADNIARHKETILSYQADAEILGFSDSLKGEIETIINDMRNDEALLRQGGSLLGEAIVNGFVGDGLGIHSPGDSAKAFAKENERIKNIANDNIDEMRNIGFKLGKALSQGTIDGLTEKNINKIWDKAYDGTDISVLNAIKKAELKDPLIKENAHVFYNSWGDKRFNPHINEYLRRETSDFILKDEKSYISPEMENLLTDYNIETISSLSTILGRSLLQTKGLPFDLKLYRQGKTQTADNGFGILTGVTSTAYDPDLTESYKNSGNELLEILAPKGTQGMNLFDWEYTLAPNTPYIELGQTEEDITRLLLLPPKQQQKYSFYPEGLDNSFRISPSAAIANTGWVDSDIGYDVDGVTFDDFLYDNENIARAISTDGYHYFDNDKGTLLTSNYQFDFANEIDEELISANNAILDNFTPLSNSSLYLAQEIVSNFVHRGLGRHSPGLIVAAMMAEGHDLHEAIEEIKKIAKEDGIELGQNFAQSAIQEIEQLTDIVRNLFVSQKDKIKNKANTPIGYIRGVGEKQVQLGANTSWGVVPNGKYSYEDIVVKSASDYETSILRNFKPDQILGNIPTYSNKTLAKARQIAYDSTLDDFIKYISQLYEISSDNQYREKKQPTSTASKYKWEKYNQYINRDIVGLSAKDMLALDPEGNGIFGIGINSKWSDELKNWGELSEWVNDDEFTNPTALMHGLVGTSAENQKIFEISKQNLTKHILKKIPPEVGKNASEASAGGANWNKVNGDLEKAINNRYGYVTKGYDKDFNGDIPFLKLTDLYKQQHDTSYKIYQNTSSKNKVYSDMSNAEMHRQANEFTEEDTTQTHNAPFVMTPSIRDFISNIEIPEPEPLYMPGSMINPLMNYHAINKRQEEIAALRKQMAEDEKRWAEEGVKYAAEKRKQLEELRRKQKAHYQLTREIQEQMDTGQLEYLIHYQNRGGVPNVPESVSKSVEDSSDDEEYRDRINKEMATKYAGLFPDMDNKFNQARYNVNKDGQGNQRIMSMIDWAEKIHDKVHDKVFSAASSIADKYDDATTQRYINGIGAAQNKIQSIAQPLSNFNDGLSRAAEIFPILSPLVWGLDTALWGLNMVSTVLELTETLLSISKMKDMLVSWGLVTAEEAETIAKGEATIVTWLLTGAIGGLEAIMSGPLLIVIAAIVAAIAVLYISEKNHAEALKENQKALEENNKSMNAALANYKSLHQARLSAINVGRQRIAALKESIALYKLETARSERLNNIRKKSQLENDPVWGETGSLRADMQTRKGLGAYLGFLFPVFRTLAGEYEPVADKHSENIYQTMSIIDEAQQSNALTDFITRHDSSFGDAVQLYQKQHTEQFAQMDAFAPQLQELYEVETQAQRIYGKEGARDSDMFKRALQDVANETGLSGETLGAYLDYMQVEANVENARMVATGGFNEIQAKIQSDAMQELYGDNNQMGDLDSLQDTMVKAMVEDEARKAKRELFEQGMMSYMQAIYSFIGGHWEEGWSYVRVGNGYLNGMRTIDENKQRILEESKEIAEENLRKDYGTGAYSIYGDTPFGGAVESAKSIGLSVPTSSSSQSHNSSITSSNTTKNINKTTSDAQTASNTAKKLIDQQKTSGQSNANAETSEESGEGLWLGDIAKSAVSGALDFAKKYSPLVGVISAFLPDKEHSEVQPTVNKYEIKVEQININTEDDPEKIKSALMNLIIEMQEQITPRQVSRTIGELPQQTADAAANMVEDIDEAVKNVFENVDNAFNYVANGLNNQK